MSNKNLIGSFNKLLLHYTKKREKETLFLRICEGTNEKPIFTISKIVFWHVANTLLSFRYDILYFSFASLLRSQYFARVCLPIFPAPFIDSRALALLYLRCRSLYRFSCLRTRRAANCKSACIMIHDLRTR